MNAIDVAQTAHPAVCATWFHSQSPFMPLSGATTDENRPR